MHGSTVCGLFFINAYCGTTQHVLVVSVDIIVVQLEVMSNSLQPHGLQHTRLPYPSLSPRVCSNSCPWSHWCHPTISFSVTTFSPCLQSFPTQGGFSNESALSIRWPNIGVSASVSVLPMNIQGWFPLGCTGLISLQSQGLSRVFSSTTVQKPQFSDPALTFFMVQFLHLYMTTGKTIALSMQTFISRVMFLLLQRPNYKFTHRFSTAWRIGAPPCIVQGSTVLYKR